MYTLVQLVYKNLNYHLQIQFKPNWCGRYQQRQEAIVGMYHSETPNAVSSGHGMFWMSGAWSYFTTTALKDSHGFWLLMHVVFWSYKKITYPIHIYQSNFLFPSVSLLGPKVAFGKSCSFSMTASTFRKS